MSLTQDDRHEIFSEAVARWADRLADGASWDEVEAEILTSCHGRVDLVTQLLIHTETRALRPDASAGRAGRRLAVHDACQEGWSGGTNVPRVATGRPVDAVWHLPLQAPL